jgi:hypothetical protein
MPKTDTKNRGEFKTKKPKVEVEIVKELSLNERLARDLALAEERGEVIYV